MSGLFDLEELVLRCRTERSRILIEEAAAAYRAGAYRASIVTTWIAVQFDLVDKFRELALQGDGQAKIVIGDFDKHLQQLDAGNQQAISKALEFERTALATARDKFQLLDAQQFTDMRRLQDDRNRCAHPTYQRDEATYQPSAELARTHLRNAVIDLISQPPVQGRAAIETVISAVKSKFFPKDRDQIRALLRTGPLGRPTVALVNGTVDALFWGLFDGDSGLKNNAAAVKALAAIVDMHRSIAEPRVKSQSEKLSIRMSDDNIPTFIALTCGVPEAWDGCGEPQKETLKRYIRDAPIDKVYKLLVLTAKAQHLSAATKDRIESTDMVDLGKMISAGLGREAVSRAVEIFASAGSWHSANTAADLLVLPLVDHITEDDIRTIVRSPREKGSDLRSSGGLARFVAAVRERKTMEPANLNILLNEENMDYLVQ